MRELFVIDEVAVDSSLLNRKFACDLLKCKGACCSLPGGRGAPLLDSEIPEMHAALPEVLPLLSNEKRKLVEKYGFYEGNKGDYATTCVDDEDCVFVYRENGIAKCAIEKAYDDGKVGFKKPISCNLYPIRVSRFGGDVLRYHELKECDPAVKKGESDNVGVIEFLRSALTRLYGEEWYSELEISAGLKPVEKR